MESRLPPRPDRKPRVGLVLSGGAARGAYEAGVIAYLRDHLHLETGVRAHFDVLCGSSVGAINACFLAATAHLDGEQGALLARIWSTLELENVLRLRTTDVMRFGRALLGLGPPVREEHRHGGIIDSEALERLVVEMCPWGQIHRNVAAGRVSALAVAATHVGTGHTVIFLQRTSGGAPAFGPDPFVHPLVTRMRPQHALASAAIPILFPAVPIDGRWYCDGGLRLNTPISPALRLGAERVLVISLRHRPRNTPQAERFSAPPPALDDPPSPYLLFGKVINALWLDHVDHDLDRLERTNAFLDAGSHVAGPEFEARLNAQLSAHGKGAAHRVPSVRILPSRDLGALAGETVRAPEFLQRNKGLAASLLRRMVDADSPNDIDIASYLLFDAAYCKALVDLGFEDARAQRDGLARFFDGG